MRPVSGFGNTAGIEFVSRFGPRLPGGLDRKFADGFAGASLSWSYHRRISQAVRDETCLLFYSSYTARSGLICFAC
jgi:hypothetical protein